MRAMRQPAGEAQRETIASRAAVAVPARRGCVNRAFGDRLNPLLTPRRDHLLPCSGWWPAAACTLRLLRDRRGRRARLGGGADAPPVVRRAASCAVCTLLRLRRPMVVTMLLHRCCAPLRLRPLRGFRWFSWLSARGADLNVYVSGINGYMLPWGPPGAVCDHRQLLEWIDWLPGFGGTLMRNLIHLEHRPLLLAARLHAHRHPAGGAAADVHPRAARASRRARIRCGAPSCSASAARCCCWRCCARC